ncbi:carbohydrate-binding domain-containing protein [Mariniblastus fucicola]|uniref:Carbohydrate binding module xylan-binding domain-containing protein n=1 Tax=Mariniblastus fucicola TaxID=980251 RepID=A0A5B9P9M6_9BACT|nr:carbohydrate-binding domain-containing protein [Mariniblastus fucicola]QEG23457.1 hypothetical protein MFFC18_33560 [Mariniblastus fucicola]
MIQKPEISCSLKVEALENRMMLSSVSILGYGHTGEETMSLLVDQQVVQTWENVGTEERLFNFETEESLSPDQVRIAFTNDLYLPEQGIDRNLSVALMTIDGQTFATNDPGVLSVGVWNPEVGAIVSGYGQGDTLHASGYFEFAAPPLTSIDFAGRTWEVVDGSPTPDDLFLDDLGELTLGGARGPLAISTELAVVGGEKYRLTLDANREFISGGLTSQGPWSTVGINFYDNNGQLQGQEQIEINTAQGFDGDRFVEAPEGATTGFLWAWIDDYNDPNDTFVPLKISAVDWLVDDAVTPDDNTPPEASFTPFTFDSFGATTLNFGVDFSDNQELAPINRGVILVISPDGRVTSPPIAFGPPTNTDSFQTLVFTMEPPFGRSEWTSEDNGEYVVQLDPGKLSDAAGNVADGRRLGTFSIDIQTPVDTTPPVVELVSSPGVITTPPTGGRGNDVQFTVTYTDDIGLGNLVQDRILVEGPNGYFGFGRGIAGGGADPNGFFEISYIPLPADGFWSDNENGTYTISLVDGTVVDQFGNYTDGRQLGTFEIAIPGIDVV